jgi:hypothetical protein
MDRIVEFWLRVGLYEQSCRKKLGVMGLDLCLSSIRMGTGSFDNDRRGHAGLIFDDKKRRV